MTRTTRWIRFAAALIAALYVLPAAAGAADVYTIDKAHSEASFQIRHLVSQVRGRFDEFSGTIRYDKADPAKSSVEFTIQAASVNTFLPDRDKHLRSDDFFAVEKFPQIGFQSTKVEKTGEGTFRVTGDLTMRGVTKQVVLPVTFLGEVADPWGNVKGGFETAITLNRKDFGINWNAALDQGGFVLADDVKVAINLEVTKEKAPA